MPQPDDPEAQTEVKERQVVDTGEKQNTKPQSSGMSARRLTSPSPHLSSSGGLWRSFWQAVVHVHNRVWEGG
jgi:hypothetical protein